MTRKLYKNSYELLELYFKQDVSVNSPMELRSRIIKDIKQRYGSELNDSNTLLDLYLNKCSTINWNPKGGFIKMFSDSLKKYNFTTAEKALLFDLSDYVMFETNLIIDQNGNPLNLTNLSKSMGVDKKALGKKINSLANKNVIHKFKLDNKSDYYFILNPKIYFKGKKIDSAILYLFRENKDIE